MYFYDKNRRQVKEVSRYVEKELWYLEDFLRISGQIFGRFDVIFMTKPTFHILMKHVRAQAVTENLLEFYFSYNTNLH